MHRYKVLLLSRAMVIVMLVPVAPASAEWFADLYLGDAFTQSHDIKIRNNATATATVRPLDVNFQSVHFNSSVTGGGRAGYWFQSLPYLGLGLDVSHFQPDVDSQNVELHALGTDRSIPASFAGLDLSVTTLSFDLMLREPLLKTPEFPTGRLQPYLTVGPAVFFARASGTTFVPSRQSATDTALGVKTGAGLAWQFHKHIAIFAEYRFTHCHPTFTFTDVFPPTGEPIRDKVSSDIDTHYVIGGVSVRF